MLSFHQKVKKIAFETDTGFSGTVQGALALAAKDVQV